MELNEKSIKEISAIALIIAFAVLVLLIIRPIFSAILWGLIIAYVSYPVFDFLNKYVGNRSLSAAITLLLVIIILIIPLWFIIPIMIQQIFEIFKLSQSIDLYGAIKSLFPTASEAFSLQLTTSLNSFASKLASSSMNSLINTFVNLPLILVSIVISGFIFFFALRDSDKLKEFIKGISPITKSREKILVKNFKEITYSIVYGNIIVGIVQGIVCGIGFWIFGIKNAIALSAIAIFLAILPVAGVFILWIPIAIYLFAQGNIPIAIAFVFYNILIVSNTDNILRAYIVSKSSNLSTLFALISSIGGLFAFGVIGLILGPLIFAYFIILLDLYREKNLLSLFYETEPKEKETPLST